MAMTLKDLYALPSLLPVPKLDGHIIGGSKNEGLRRVDGDSSDVVRVSFEGGNLLGSVVVVNTQLEVIGTTDNPVLSRDESTGSDGNIGKLKGLDNLLSFV